MLDLIVGFAEADERIRAVVMNGSRVNPNAAKDPFRDYDIINFVMDVEPFRNEEYVCPRFGEAFLIQKPEDKISPPPTGDGHYSYNMQLADGNRIDLSFCALASLPDLTEDSLTRVLLDKDGLLPDPPAPSERSYFITEPTRQLYEDCCDQFLFCLGSHLPKTFWRRQLPLVHFYIEIDLRPPLLTMLGWEIGTRTGFDRSLGKAGTRLQEYLPPEDWNQYRLTYADADLGHIWESLSVFYELFRRTAEAVGHAHGFRFPAEDGDKAWAFLEHVSKLPEDATSIF